MKILHIYGHDFGGNFVITQLKGLIKLGHTVKVICTGHGVFYDKAKDAGADVLVVDFQGYRISDLKKILLAIFKIRKIIKDFNPDVVHYHLIKAIIIGRLSVLFMNVKKKISELGGPLTLEKNFFRYIDLATSWVDTDVICSSKKIKEIYSNYPWIKNKCTLLHYAFDTSIFTGIDKKSERIKVRSEFGYKEDDFIVGMVAYMYNQRFSNYNNAGLKGHEFLIDAIKLCKAHCQKDNIKFLIVGEDLDNTRIYFNELVALVKSLGLSKHVIFTGNRSDVASILASLDVAVVPSISENCGGAVEPLLMSVPVIASNTGGLTDVVIEDSTGWLFEVGDTKGLYSCIMEAYNTNAEVLKCMGEAGRDIVIEYFEPNKNICKLNDVYQRVIY